MNTLKLFIPPIIPVGIKKINKILNSKKPKAKDEPVSDSSKQDLNIYWTDDMAYQLENWGKDHTWIEIECLLVNCKGKVLDIACGTGVNIKAMSRFTNLEIHGFDISDFLLESAKKKGINPDFLKVADATKTSYKENEYDYSYSIGSLEHFTEEGISEFLKEASRYTSKASFHMVPVSENNLNNGWIKRGQSYFNNSVEWWLVKYQKHFSKVYVVNSGWKDNGVSVGKWFICYV